MENNQQPLSSQEQGEQPHSVSPATSHSPSKTFITLMVVILIVAVGVGGYFLGAKQSQVVQNQTQPVTPTVTPTDTPITKPSRTPILTTFALPTTEPSIIADWRTYRNEKYGFKIQYPPGLIKIQEEEPGVYDLSKIPLHDFELEMGSISTSTGSIGNDLIIRIAVTSRQFQEKVTFNGLPIYSVAQWDREKNFLLDNKIYTDCSLLLFAEAKRENICRITKINDIEMMDRVNRWPPGGDPARSLIFYGNNMRYDIFIGGSSEAFDAMLPYLAEDQNRFSFIPYDYPPKGSSWLKLSNQILSTFKFTD